MDNEKAILEKIIAEIENLPLLEKHAKDGRANLFNWNTDKFACPECGRDTDASPADKKSLAYCDHCRKYFSNIDYFIKAHGARKINGKYSNDDIKLAAIMLCKPLGIDNPFKPVELPITKTITADVATVEELKKTATDTKDNAAVNAPSKPKNAPKTAEGTFNPKDDKKALFGLNMGQFIDGYFDSYVDNNKKFSGRKTGFENLDEQIYSFQPGIYILGGLAALGKTTFALQLLEQMARQGETCIYCSYEMQAGFLYSKLLAREVARITTKNFAAKIADNTLTASQISYGRISNEYRDAYIKARENFLKNPIPLYIWELAEVNINKLLNRINGICNQLEKPPVVVIDYLQLLAGDTDNTKTALDSALRNFFNFRRETNTTFIIISSLNRANYNTKISFESFKETGNIEYSADAIWGLQFILDEHTPDAIAKAKKQIPREIELKCLKNRFGANFDVGFYYYPQADHFKPMLEYGEIVSTFKGKGRSSRADETSDERDN